MKFESPLKFAADLPQLDRAFRARRTGQSPVEYAASVQHFRRPRRHVGSYLVTAALLFGAILMARVA